MLTSGFKIRQLCMGLYFRLHLPLHRVDVAVVAPSETGGRGAVCL